MRDVPLRHHNEVAIFQLRERFNKHSYLVVNWFGMDRMKESGQIGQEAGMY